MPGRGLQGSFLQNSSQKFTLGSFAVPALGVHDQNPFPAVPFRKYQAFQISGNRLMLMDTRSMRMTVDQALDPMPLGHVKNRIRIGIHDLWCFAAFVNAAFVTVPARIESSHPQRFAEGPGFPFRSTHSRSGNLIALIIGTEEISVGDQGVFTVEIQNFFIGQKADTCSPFKVGSDQEITISML